MLLNQLYGYFCRKLEYLETVNVNKNKLDDYLTTQNVYSLIEINDDVFTLLIESDKLNHKLIKDFNITIQKSVRKEKFKTINSNIAIAAAVTAYARLYLIKYKTIPGNVCLYTDTDSAFLVLKNLYLVIYYLKN